MNYTVLKIEEDLDFGCEERRENDPVMAVVTLQDENGEQTRIRYPDQKLYDLNINESDQVRFDGEKELCPVDK